MGEQVVFTIGNAKRTKSFDDLMRKYFNNLMRLNSMFPGAMHNYSMEPTDQVKGSHENSLDYRPGDVVNVQQPGKGSLTFVVPKGKKATRIKYNYEVILEDLPKCDQCHGSGQISLFTTVETCGGCNGSGYKR